VHFQLLSEKVISILIQCGKTRKHPVQPFPSLLVRVKDNYLDLAEVSNDCRLDRKTVIRQSLLNPTLDGVRGEEMLVEDQILGALDTHLL